MWGPASHLPHEHDERDAIYIVLEDIIVEILVSRIYVGVVVWC